MPGHSADMGGSYPSREAKGKVRARNSPAMVQADRRDEMTLAGRTAEPASAQGLDDGSADDGVMWSRHFAVDEFVQACAVLKESLSILRAKRMVVAHTRQPTITSRCQDQVWAIDVGISRYYGGDLLVLEIVDARQVRIVSPT